MGSQPPLGTSTCSSMGSSIGCRWICAPPWTSMGCRGTVYLSIVFSTGCRGISTLVPGAPPPPPSSLTLVSAGLLLSHILSPLSGYSSAGSPTPLPLLLKYVIAEVLPPLLMGLALASSGSVFEPAGIGSIRHGGSFLQLLTEATPVSPSATKTLQRKSNTVLDKVKLHRYMVLKNVIDMVSSCVGHH